MHVLFFCCLFSFEIAYGLFRGFVEVHSLPPDVEAEVTESHAKQVLAGAYD